MSKCLICVSEFQPFVNFGDMPIANAFANKEDLKLIALGEKDVKALKGWRYDIFGSFAIKLMEGKFSLKIKNGSVIID